MKTHLKMIESQIIKCQTAGCKYINTGNYKIIVGILYEYITK